MVTPYVNSIPLEGQPPFPGDLAMEQRLAALMRWNALAMVMRANRVESGGSAELGGHIASYASAADLFEVGFNHFFRARDAGSGGQLGDLVFFQPHSAPGVYARAFLEGRLSAEDLAHYRQELTAPGTRRPRPDVLSASAADARLLAVPDRLDGHRPDQRHLPGALHALPAASRPAPRAATPVAQQRRVWGFFGDGEMDEPESIAALSLAARERLDNCTFVINCNLQRLDGPVRGNGRIVDELESLFAGAGWHVIKCLWSSDWDVLFARDRGHALMRAFAQTVDGEFQTLVGQGRRVQPRGLLRP